MIRKLTKAEDKCKLYDIRHREIINVYNVGFEEIFVNDDNFLHNDVGFAISRGIWFGWFWKGIEIK